VFKVFIIDDEPFIQEGLKYIIDWGEYGFEIIGTASNGVEALEVMRNIKADLIITDIRMPEMDGLELIKEIKKENIDAKFIVLSGYDDFKYLKESINLGIENYLLKPVNKDELQATLRRTADRIENYKLVNRYISKDKRIIRDNILYRWVTGAINSTELKDRAGLLELDLLRNWFCVSIIKCFDKTVKCNMLSNSNASNNRNLQSMAYEIIKNDIEDNNCGLVFYGSGEQIVVLFSGTEKANNSDEINGILRSCMINMESEINCKVLITVGKFEFEYINVYKSYEDALNLNRQYFNIPSSNILDCNKTTMPHSAGITKNPLVCRVLEYIDLNYNKDISLKILALRLNTNANYLGGLFKEETGELFSDYLNNFRINKAKDFLVNTKIKISEISGKVGYTDPAYFFKLFKKSVGVSPKVYRQQLSL